MRPSLLDGSDGFGARWIRRVAQWPLHFVPVDALGDLAPLHVDDLGEAIAALCECPSAKLPTSVELGGETRYQMAAYLRAMRRSPSPPLTLRVPRWLVRGCAHLFDALHCTPLSWGHVELMRRDNLPCSEDTFALRRWLGRAPIGIGVRPPVRRPLAVAAPIGGISTQS